MNLNIQTATPTFGGSTGGWLRSAEIEEKYAITWTSPKEQIFEMPTAGAAIMRTASKSTAISQALFHTAYQVRCRSLVQCGCSRADTFADDATGRYFDLTLPIGQFHRHRRFARTRHRADVCEPHLPRRGHGRCHCGWRTRSDPGPTRRRTERSLDCRKLADV